VIGDHLSSETNWKIRTRVSFSVLAIFVVTVIQVNRWAPYSFVGLSITIPWFVGLTLWDHQEFERRTRRASGQVMNFAMAYGMSSGRLMSLSGGGELRPDPHPTPVAWNAESQMWVINNPETSTVEHISIGGTDIQVVEPTMTPLGKPTRISRYERISDPLKWVI
jgi:hypothetical protein